MMFDAKCQLELLIYANILDAPTVSTLTKSGQVDGFRALSQNRTDQSSFAETYAVSAIRECPGK
jgi:hypothetical protein